MRSFILLVLTIPVLSCTEVVDSESDGPLGLLFGPRISIGIQENELREDNFGFDIGFIQPDVMPFTYSAQIIGPTQLSQDLFLAKDRIIRPKDNPSIESFSGVDIYCGTFYEVRVKATNRFGTRTSKRVFRSSDCTSSSEGTCSVSNLTFAVGDTGENYLRFALAGTRSARGCTWIVETKSGSHPLSADYQPLLRGEVEEDQLVEESLPPLASGINWFRVTAFDHTPVRRSPSLENAFHIP